MTAVDPQRLDRRYAAVRPRGMKFGGFSFHIKDHQTEDARGKGPRVQGDAVFRDDRAGRVDHGRMPMDHSVAQSPQMVEKRAADPDAVLRILLEDRTVGIDARMHEDEVARHLLNGGVTQHFEVSAKVPAHTVLHRSGCEVGQAIGL